MDRASVNLARHGQTAYNLERRFQGHLPVPLDTTGRSQAAELAERVAEMGFAALWCSPLLRARETADIVAGRIGLEPKEDARLVETDAGDWTDRSFAEVQAQAPQQFAEFIAAEPGFAFPGGESFVHQEERVSAALEEIERGELPALVVCHGMVIRAALALRAGHLLTRVRRMPNAAIVALDPSEAELAELGESAATPAS